MPLPPGYVIRYGGSYVEQQSFQELLTILGAACLLVFAVGLFLFKDLKAAGLILLVAILGPARRFTSPTRRSTWAPAPA